MQSQYIKNKIPCLECGKAFTKPLAHAWQVHGMSAREYKEKHGLDLSKGIIPESHREHLRATVFATGIAQSLAQKGKHTRFKKNHTINYERSPETLERLKKHWLQVANLNGRPATVPKITIQCAHCKAPKAIYPRYYQPNNNFCSPTCRNKHRAIKNKK